MNSSRTLNLTAINGDTDEEDIANQILSEPEDDTETTDLSETPGGAAAALTSTWPED
jgi:hypothetical protein